MKEPLWSYYLYYVPDRYGAEKQSVTKGPFKTFVGTADAGKTKALELASQGNRIIELIIRDDRLNRLTDGS